MAKEGPYMANRSFCSESHKAGTQTQSEDPGPKKKSLKCSLIFWSSYYMSMYIYIYKVLSHSFVE